MRSLRQVSWFPLSHMAIGHDDSPTISPSRLAEVQIGNKSNCFQQSLCNVGSKVVQPLMMA